MTEGQFFIQMSGVPGAGKSTIASAVARQTGAVVIDHDVTKSALLVAAVPADLAGRASYDVLDALARHLLQQGHSVISVSLPFPPDLRASYVLLTADATSYTVEHRRVAYDRMAVLEAVRRLRHPGGGYIASFLLGQRQPTGAEFIQRHLNALPDHKLNATRNA